MTGIDYIVIAVGIISAAVGISESQGKDTVGVIAILTITLVIYFGFGKSEPKADTQTPTQVSVMKEI